MRGVKESNQRKGDPGIRAGRTKSVLFPAVVDSAPRRSCRGPEGQKRKQRGCAALPPSAFGTFPRKRGKEQQRRPAHASASPAKRGKLPGRAEGGAFRLRVEVRSNAQGRGCAVVLRYLRTNGWGAISLPRSASLCLALPRSASLCFALRRRRALDRWVPCIRVVAPLVVGNGFSRDALFDRNPCRSS